MTALTPTFRPSRRSLLALASLPLLTATATLTATTAVAQSAAWPDQQLRLVVPYPPGGPTDTTSRLLGQALASRLKQTVIVENRPGASGSLAATQVAKASADGTTFMTLMVPALLAPHMYKNVSYDPTKDFTPVAMFFDLPLVIVVNPQSLPEVTDLPSLIAYAKSQNPPMNYTSAGIGALGNLSMELLKQMGGFEMEHVPYKGSTPAITDTLGGHVPVMFSDMIAALPHIQAGRLRAIAVSSPQRVSMLPDVKTVSEQGFPGYAAVSWGAVVAPPGTAPAIAARVADEIRQIVDTPEMQAGLLAVGAIAHFMGPEQAQQRIQQDYERYGKVIRDNGIAVE